MASLPIGSDKELEAFLAVSTIFDAYMQAVRRVISSPRGRIAGERSLVSSRKVRKRDSVSEKWLVKHPEYVKRTDGGIVAEKAMAVRRKITYDTPENRFVRFILHSTLKQLRAFKNTVALADESLADRAEYMISTIKSIISASFLKDVPCYGAPCDMPCMATAYHELYKHYLMLKGSLSANTDIQRMGVEDKDVTVSERASFSEDIEEKLWKIDWSVKDVLVGSVGSVAQFKDNLKRNYYYVPAKHVNEGDLPVRYIALYQSANMFNDEAGIRYYGLVTQMKKLRRKDIKFPTRRNNGDELYYAFRVREWESLPEAIAIKDEGVFEPKFTNMFLLENCTQSYELFNIHSNEQYRLLNEVKRIFSDDALNDKSHSEIVYPLEDGKSILVQGESFDIMDENGERLFEQSLKISDFIRHPRDCFGMIIQKLKNK